MDLAGQEEQNWKPVGVGGGGGGKRSPRGMRRELELAEKSGWDKELIGDTENR